MKNLLVIIIVIVIAFSYFVGWALGAIIGWVVFFLLIIGIPIAFVCFVGWAIVGGFANKFPMDKYNLLTTIADDDVELQQQKDMFISKAIETEYFVGSQNEDIVDVKKNIQNLIYPNQKYASLTCPFCSGKLFWIFGFDSINWDNEIRYFALCSHCVKVVHQYDESVYDWDVFKRIDSIVPDKKLQSEYIGKIGTVEQKRRKLNDELNF